jgi:hypothetical protein
VRRLIQRRDPLVAAACAAALALAAALAGLPDAPRIDAAGSTVPDHVTIRLRSAGDSEVEGKATLRAGDGITTVAIRLAGPAGSYPTHIREGTCQVFEPVLDFPLTDAEPGRITRTVVEIPLAELLAGTYVINVHRPTTDLGTLLDPSSLVACGTIEALRQPAPEETPQGVTNPPVTGAGTTIAGQSMSARLVALGALAVALACAGFALGRSERLPPTTPASRS